MGERYALAILPVSPDFLAVIMKLKQDPRFEETRFVLLFPEGIASEGWSKIKVISSFAVLPDGSLFPQDERSWDTLKTTYLEEDDDRAAAIGIGPSRLAWRAVQMACELPQGKKDLLYFEGDELRSLIKN